MNRWGAEKCTRSPDSPLIEAAPAVLSRLCEARLDVGHGHAPLGVDLLEGNAGGIGILFVRPQVIEENSALWGLLHLVVSQDGGQGGRLVRLTGLHGLRVHHAGNLGVVVLEKGANKVPVRVGAGHGDVKAVALTRPHSLEGLVGHVPATVVAGTELEGVIEIEDAQRPSRRALGRTLLSAPERFHVLTRNRARGCDVVASLVGRSDARDDTQAQEGQRDSGAVPHLLATSLARTPILVLVRRFSSPVPVEGEEKLAGPVVAVVGVPITWYVPYPRLVGLPVSLVTLPPSDCASDLS